MTPLRGFLALALLVLAAWFLVAVFAPEPAAAPPGLFASSRDCAACHPAAWEEWEGSRHADSWTNPEVRAQSNDFANTDCIACHAPRPVFETGIAERVLPRSARRVEGVDCIACHQVPADDGGVHMAGTVERNDVPCRPVQRRELTRPDFCAGCHDQHKTVRQWRASEWPARGKDCLDCHMPERADGTGRDHNFHGGDSLDMLKQAVELRGERAGAGWRVEVENVGAGHSFPTDERSRAADVFWRPLGTTSADDWRHLYRFRSPYRTEVDVAETLLAAHATLELQLDEPGPVEVALFYKRSPYWADAARPDPEREAVLVHRIELVP